MTDTLYALAAVACIGSYMVPARFATAKGAAFLPFMGLGMAAVGLALFNPFQALLPHPLWLAGTLLSGVLWALGQGLANIALAEISLAKAAVLFNINSFLNIALGLVVFHEASGSRAYLLLLAGGVLLFIGAWVVSRITAPVAKEGNLRKGVWLSLLAGFCWGVYFLPVKALQTWDAGAGLSSLDVLSGMILGGALSALLSGCFHPREHWTLRNMGLGALTAVLWAAGTICFLLIIRTLGLSRAVPIVNSNILVYALWSLAFGELHVSQWRHMLAGFLLVAAGVAFLAFSN
jgi:drug/metabolite transporter (DMT)-like permease